MIVLGDFAQTNFHCFHGERCVLADALDVAGDVFFEFICRQHAIDQAHVFGFLRVELARGVKNLRGIGWADDVDQALQRAVLVTHAEFAGRYAKLGIVAADAQVAGERRAEAAAHAEAADHRDRRLGAVEQLVGDGDRHLVELGDHLRIGALFLELADVGARHKRLVARAFQHDHAYGLVANQLIQRDVEPQPHLIRHGVALGRVVEGDPARGAVLVREQFFGVGVDLHNAPKIMNRIKCLRFFRQQRNALCNERINFGRAVAELAQHGARVFAFVRRLRTNG